MSTTLSTSSVYSIKKTAPAHLHKKLIPDFAFGGKRLIYDVSYLASREPDCMSGSKAELKCETACTVNLPNISYHDERATKFFENGLVLADGTQIEADVVLAATGERNTHIRKQQVS